MSRTTTENLTLDGYDLWSELTDAIGSVDELRAELARRADEGDEIAALHRNMFGPWSEGSAVMTDPSDALPVWDDGHGHVHELEEWT